EVAARQGDGGVGVRALVNREARGVERQGIVRGRAHRQGERCRAIAGGPGAVHGQVVDAGGHPGTHVHRQGGTGPGRCRRNEGPGDAGRRVAQAQRHRPGEVGPGQGDRRVAAGAGRDGEGRRVEGERIVRGDRVHGQGEWRGAVTGHTGAVHG